MLIARREWGMDPNGYSFDGKWVLREDDGSFLFADYDLNKVKEKFKGEDIRVWNS